MSQRKQINSKLEKVIVAAEELIEVEVIDEYHKLNQTCDKILEKIKKRKLNTKK